MPHQFDLFGGATSAQAETVPDRKWRTASLFDHAEVEERRRTSEREDNMTMRVEIINLDNHRFHADLCRVHRQEWRDEGHIVNTVGKATGPCEDC